MSLIDHVVKIRDAVGALPASASKVKVAQLVDEFMEYCRKHEYGDQAISDEYHKLCSSCQVLTVENHRLKLKLGELD